MTQCLNNGFLHQGENTVSKGPAREESDDNPHDRKDDPFPQLLQVREDRHRTDILCEYRCNPISHDSLVSPVFTFKSISFENTRACFSRQCPLRCLKQKRKQIYSVKVGAKSRNICDAIASRNNSTLISILWKRRMEMPSLEAY